MMIYQQMIYSHLGITFDTKLNFQEHIKNRFKKFNKTIELLRKLQNILPQAPLLAIYKSFRRPHYNYGCCAVLYNICSNL